MCIYFSLLLLYQFLGVLTFHDSASLRGKPNGSEQCQALIIFSLLACPLLLATGSRRSIFSFCFRLVYKPTIFLDTVDRDTTNQKKYLDKDKTECVNKDKALIPRSGVAPPTQL